MRGAYNLYKIGDKELKQYEENHLLFQKMVGYHTDHLPEIYKPYIENNTTSEFSPTIINLSKKFIKKVYWNEFKYFNINIK